MLCYDVMPSPGDFCNCLTPRNTCKFTTAFGANSSHRIEQPFRMIDAVQVAIDFGAEPAACHWMVGATPHTDGSFLLIYLGFQRTTVRAVMWADTIDGAKVLVFGGMGQWFE